MRRAFPGLLLLLLAVTTGAGAGERLRVTLGTAVPRAFAMPFDLAVFPSGLAAVLEDSGGRISLAGEGAGAGFEVPRTARAVAADEAGELLVLAGGTTLLGFRDGRKVRTAALALDPAPAEPVGMAARNRILWVVDRKARRLHLVGYDGRGLGHVDLAGRARAPFSVALGAAGEAFVTDPLGPAVLSFSPSGTYLGALDLSGTGVTRPTGVAVDGRGRVWVSDTVTGDLACFGPDGAAAELLWKGPERLVDPLRLSWGGDRLWVLEGRPGRVRWIRGEEP